MIDKNERFLLFFFFFSFIQTVSVRKKLNLLLRRASSCLDDTRTLTQIRDEKTYSGRFEPREFKLYSLLWPERYCNISRPFNFCPTTRFQQLPENTTSNLYIYITLTHQLAAISDLLFGKQTFGIMSRWISCVVTACDEIYVLISRFT